MVDDCITNGLLLLVSFYKVLLFLNFKFLQKGNSEGATADFLARHITVRYYVMLESISKMEGDGYQTHIDFIDYKKRSNNLSDNDREIQE